MSGASTYTFVVTALDRATANLVRIQGEVRALESPITNVNKKWSGFANAAGFENIEGRVEGITRRFERMSGVIGGMPLGILGGAATFGGIFELARKAADFGAGLYKGERTTGVPVGDLARLHYVADQSEVSVDTLDKALAHLNSTVAQIMTGKGKEAARWFKHLGIGIRDAHHHIRPTIDIFGDLSQAILINPVQAVRAGAVHAALGDRIGKELIPMLELGRDETRRLGTEFDRLHGKVTEADAISAKASEDGFKKLNWAVGGLGNSIGNALLPYLNPVIDSTSKWISENRAAAASAILVGGAVIGTAFLLPMFGTALSFAAAGAGALFTGMLAVGGFMGDFVTAIGLGMTAMEGFDIAMDANPIGLLILAIVALAGVAYLIWKYWEPIGDFFVGLWDYVVTAFKWAWNNVLKWTPAGQLVDQIIKHWNVIGPFFEGVWQRIVSIFQKYYGYIEPIIAALNPFAGLMIYAPALGGALAPVIAGGIGDIAAHGHALRNPAVGGGGHVDVHVQFDNTPPGVRVHAQSGGNASHTLDVGKGQRWSQ